MQIPQFWARATAKDADARGRERAFSCWRSSDNSQQEAQESALAAATRIVRKMAAGDKLDRYGYGQGLLREEVIQRFTNSSGELFAAVTRNAYGALVLNTARVMFIDIDFAPAPVGTQVKSMFGRLFGRKPAAPVVDQERVALDRIGNFIENWPEWNLRLYRTHSGLRGLATHALFDPVAPETRAMLQELASDPLYIRLCQTQGSFRARLTPKPWRCGMYRPPAWPRESPRGQTSFDKWLTNYTTMQSRFATCRFVENLGSGEIHPDAQTILEVHDHITHATEPLALA